MKKNKFAPNMLLFGVLAILMAACEPEFSQVGSDIITDPNYNTPSATFNIKTYNKAISTVQSNLLDNNYFGFSNDPIFGNFTANFVAQVSPATLNPTFGVNTVLDSVVLTIPYFSRITEVDEDNNNLYELDSVYGNAPIKISIFENNYFLRDFDPDADFNDQQKYFSDRSTSTGETINISDLEGTLLYENDEFQVSNDPVILTVQEFDEDGEPVLDEDGEPVFTETERLAPSLRIKLDNPGDNYWQERFFEKEDDVVLTNENNFLNYFRGLYFKAETVSPEGTLALLNVGSTNSNVTLYYTTGFDEGDDDNDGIPNFADVDPQGDGSVTNSTNEDGDGINDTYDVDQTGGIDENGDGIDDDLDGVSSSYTLNITGNRVNFLENDLNNFPGGNEETGDPKLYLKGTEGNMAVIELFDPEDDSMFEEFEEFSDYDGFIAFAKENWLINEARLTFFVDQSIAQNQEPDRVYISDLANNIFLADWEADQSAGLIPELAKTDHLQPLVREGDEDNGQGIRYRIEITEHLKNLIQNDSTNNKLGLFVTSNVLSVDNIELKDQEGLIETITQGTFLTPRGTVLHGSHFPSNTLKRPILEIFYTEPEN